jgi:hypothetical protein
MKSSKYTTMVMFVFDAETMTKICQSVVYVRIIQEMTETAHRTKPMTQITCYLRHGGECPMHGFQYLF